MIRKEIFLLLSLMMILMFLPDVQAQNSTSSPFSIFGIGEYEIRDFGRTTGLGSVGIGYQSQNFLNRRNPAGLSGIDTLRFILDVSAAIKISEFRTKSVQAQSTNFNFKSMAVGVRVSKKWTSSVGLAPYSNVGYNMTAPDQNQGTDQPKASFTGSGGINKFYWANAVELFQGFSLGATSSYIFGNFTKSEEKDIFTIQDVHNVSKIYFDFGVQYSHRFGNFTQVTVGGVYGYESKMPIQHMRMTISNNMLESRQRQPDDRNSYIPESYGAGFSILRNKKAAEWVFAADYQFRNFSVDRSRVRILSYSDSHTYSAGLQFTPNKNGPDNYLQVIRFQLGACYNQSYLKVNGYQLEDYSVSLGVGLPFRNLSYVNIAVNVGESGTGKRGGINERYVLLSMNMSLIERWFAKFQFN